MSKAKLNNAGLSGAKVSNAKFAGVDLTGATYAPVSEPPEPYAAGMKGLATLNGHSDHQRLNENSRARFVANLLCPDS